MFWCDIWSGHAKSFSASFLVFSWETDNLVRFHESFMSLILSNLRASFFSILIIGSLAGFFKGSSWIKQGHPLSPYLFILLTEAFSLRFWFLIDDGAIQYVAPRAFLILYLCFKDDLLVFMYSDRRSLRQFMVFLNCYEKGTGQWANKGKSSFIMSAHYLQWVADSIC